MIFYGRARALSHFNRRLLVRFGVWLFPISGSFQRSQEDSLPEISRPKWRKSRNWRTAKKGYLFFGLPLFSEIQTTKTSCIHNSNVINCDVSVLFCFVHSRSCISHAISPLWQFERLGSNRRHHMRHFCVKPCENRKKKLRKPRDDPIVI